MDQGVSEMGILLLTKMSNYYELNSVEQTLVPTVASIQATTPAGKKKQHKN